MFTPFNVCKMLRKQCRLQLLMCFMGGFAVFQILTMLIHISNPDTESMGKTLTGRVPKAFYIAEDTNNSSTFSDKWPNVTRLKLEIEHYLSRNEKSRYKFPWNFQFKDNRDASCRQFENQFYVPKNSVSIILGIGNAHLVQVLSSVLYILHNTPESLVNSITIVGDTRISENDFEILEDLLTPVPFFRTFRLPNFTFELEAGYFASKFTQALYFVMMNAKVLVTRGWLEPLVFTLRNEYRNVAIPNVILSDNETAQDLELSYSRRRELDLDLELKWGAKVPDTKRITRNPAVYEHLFLVSAKYFTEIGGFDAVRGASGAEAVIWSIKTWMCRGQILMSPCSRVYETDLLPDNKIINDQNSKIMKYKLYIARNLMGTDQNSYLCLSSVFNRSPRTRGTRSNTLYFSSRARNFYQNTLKCSSFRTFLTSAQPELQTRPKGTEYFGKLKVKDTEIYLHPDLKKTKLLLVGNNTQMGRDFRFDSYKFMYGSKCVDVKNNELLLSRCSNLNSSAWTYQNNVFKLRNNPNNCLTYVSDPTGQSKGTLKLLPCVSKQRQINHFVFSWHYAKNCV